MADVTFRIPSKAVTYGYIEVLVPAAPEATPEMLAARYVNYVYAFQKEEQAALKRLQEGTGAPQGASQEAPPGDLQAAAERLADGRKPRTVDEANEMAKQLIEQELGATKLDEYNHDGPGDVEAAAREAYDAAYSAPNDGPEPAPWSSTVAPKPKPWETGTAAPKAADLGDGW